MAVAERIISDARPANDPSITLCSTHKSKDLEKTPKYQKSNIRKQTNNLENLNVKNLV